MSEVKGLKETKEVLDFAIGAVTAVNNITADKKIDFSDLAHVMALLPIAGPALDGVKEIPAELMDLTSQEGVEMVAYVAAKLSLENSHAKDIALAAMKAAVATFELIKAVKAPVVVA